MANIIANKSLGNKRMVEVDADPSISIPENLPPGSIAAWDESGETIGKLAIKTGPNSTDWDTVLATFGLDWRVDWTQAKQESIVLPYKGSLYPGTRLTLVYTSAGSTDVDILLNYFLHSSTN